MVNLRKISTEPDHAVLYLRTLGPHSVSETQRELMTHCCTYAFEFISRLTFRPIENGPCPSRD